MVGLSLAQARGESGPNNGFLAEDEQRGEVPSKRLTGREGYEGQERVEV